MVRWRAVGSVALAALLGCGDGGAGETAGAGGEDGTGGDSADGGGGLGGGSGGSGGSGGAATGGGATGPRCEGLAESCGPMGDGDCCARTTVEGGSFYRSYDGVDHTDMSHPATVSTFELDVYEVTVGRFRAFLEAGMGTQEDPPAEGDAAHPLIADSGWFSGWDSYLSPDTAAFRSALVCDNSTHTWSDAPDPARETLPINCVTWFEAFAFCAWDGGRLPTEAEWNYAAAGGDEQRVYPWGSGLDENRAAYGCLGDGDSDCGFADILPVGSRSPAGDGRWGQADLAGNTWELVRDWFETYQDPCVDCARIEVTPYHTSRGGGWGSPPEGITASQRDFVGAASRSPEIGFRCAASP